LNFEGTPSQKEHKTIFHGLNINSWLCLVKVTLQRSFQQSAMLSATLTLTFRSLSITEQFPKHGAVRPSYVTKAIVDCRIPELIKFWKVIIWRLKNARKSI
jgi:hypothetical protein